MCVLHAVVVQIQKKKNWLAEEKGVPFEPTKNRQDFRLDNLCKTSVKVSSFIFFKNMFIKLCFLLLLSYGWVSRITLLVTFFHDPATVLSKISFAGL